jgi:GAF domain-containing protein
VTPSASSREQLVTEAFVFVADTLVDDYDVIDLLTGLTDYSVRLLSADAVGILLADSQDHLRVVAYSSENAQLTEVMQLEVDEGPCVDCYRTAASVTAIDLTGAAHRWPLFTALATVAGDPPFRAVHALPLRLRGAAIGAMNLFGHQPGPISPADLVLGQALADVATIAILQERAVRRAEVVAEQMQYALTSRVLIEQAKGILAQHSGLSMDEAFLRMRRWTRNRNRRLADVARDIAEKRLAPDTIAATPSEGAKDI